MIARFVIRRIVLTARDISAIINAVLFVKVFGHGSSLSYRPGPLQHRSTTTGRSSLPARSNCAGTPENIGEEPDIYTYYQEVCTQSAKLYNSTAARFNRSLCRALFALALRARSANARAVPRCKGAMASCASALLRRARCYRPRYARRFVGAASSFRFVPERRDWRCGVRRQEVCARSVLAQGWVHGIAARFARCIRRRQVFFRPFVRTWHALRCWL